LSVKVRKTASISAELDEMHHQVSQRAYELSRMNHSPRNTPEENWFNARRELIWEPPVEIRQMDDRFEVIAAVAGARPEHLDVQVAPGALLIKGRGHDECTSEGVVRHCEFSRGQLFRPIHLPEPADVENAVAEYRDGLLRVSVPVINRMVTQAAEIEEPKPARKTKPRKTAEPRQKRTKEK